MVPSGVNQKLDTFSLCLGDMHKVVKKKARTEKNVYTEMGTMQKILRRAFHLKITWLVPLTLLSSDRLLAQFQGGPAPIQPYPQQPAQYYGQAQQQGGFTQPSGYPQQTGGFGQPQNPGMGFNQQQPNYQQQPGFQQPGYNAQAPHGGGFQQQNPPQGYNSPQQNYSAPGIQQGNAGFYPPAGGTGAPGAYPGAQNPMPGQQQGFSGGMDPYGQPQNMGQQQGLGQMQNPGMNSQGFPQDGFGNAPMPANGGAQGFGASPQSGSGAAPSTPQELSPLPEDDDFHTGSQSDYADFNEEDEESEDTRFFKYGRFFGLSVGMGIQTADGNRGTLWNGGFPAIDLRLHYWFSFNFAADLGGYLSNHYFNTPTTGNVDVFFAHLGVSLKYYFDLKNFSAALSFANPHLIGGGGLYHKKEFSQSLDKTDLANAVGGNLGVGLEFAFKPRKVYLQMDGRLAYVPFADMNNVQYGMNNLRGVFYTITSRLLLTW